MAKLTPGSRKNVRVFIVIPGAKQRERACFIRHYVHNGMLLHLSGGGESTGENREKRSREERERMGREERKV
jgi:hypothetical protein